MALGKRNANTQDTLFIATQDLSRSPGHPFYERLNDLLRQHGFDRFVEGIVAPFYADGVGRPGLAPGIYFRMHFLGFFEGIDSERGIAWKCADSLSVRSFLGIPLDARTPDHSTISKVRKRLDVETHIQVFDWMLKMLLEHGLIKGGNLAIDATTLEANAAMRSLLRADNDLDYQAYLEQLGEASGIAGLKDGRTRMGYKMEHGTDLDTEAIVSVTMHPGAREVISSTAC